MIKPFRIKRMGKFMACFEPSISDRILDVGGTAYNWNLVNIKSEITLLNLALPKYQQKLADNYRLVEGDGTSLQYDDDEFDIAFSNSVIEHLYTYENQQKFTNELRRVAKKLWVQTPAKCFFLEPHLLTPFVHYLPKKWQLYLLRYFTVWGWLTRPSREAVKKMHDEIRLLNYAEMCELFPDCEIAKERFLFVTKAYVAIRK